MIERILQFSLRFPFVIILFTLIVAIYGIYSLTILPIDAVPDITNNQVQINATIPGLSPEQMEIRVTYVIEVGLAGIPGLQMTRSISRNGFSQITAIFDDDINIYFARQQINERLSEIKKNLPDDTEVRMGPISTGLGEIYMWAVEFKSKKDGKNLIEDGLPGWQSDKTYLTPEGYKLKNEVELSSYLRTIQDWIIKPQLKNVKGVAGIDSIGGYNKQYHIEPNLERMIAIGLNFNDIIESIKNNNISIGPGYIEKKGESLLVNSDERLESPKQIETIVVATRDGIPIRIKDIANVSIGKELRTGSASLNSKETVIGTALMLIGSNSRTVSQAVDDKLKEINQLLPPDIEIKILLNRSKLVSDTVKTVIKNLSEGAFLVIVILFTFLNSFRAALITALVIPLSMLITAIAMTHAKISGNLMSLGALDFGLIVDGAVIIVENCLRRLSQKQVELHRSLQMSERVEQILSASKEMIKPTVFGQIIIIIVYLSVLTLSGVEGKMFRPMAITVIFALIGAFILSLTFVPAAIAIFVNQRLKEKSNFIIIKLTDLYTMLLRKILNKPFVILKTSGFLLLFSFVLFFQLGEEFIPQLDEQDIAINVVRLPSTSLTQATEMQKDLERQILNFSEVQYVFSKTGTAEIATDLMPFNISDTFVILKPRKEWHNPNLSKPDLIKKIEESINQLPGNNYEFTQPIEMRFNELISGMRSDIAIKIYGDDYNVIKKTAENIAKVVKDTPGSADVKMTQIGGLPVLNIKVDRNGASRLGLNPDDALKVLSIAVGGGIAGQIFEGDRRFDLVVRLPEKLREDINALQNLPIPLPISLRKNDNTKTFPYVPLNEIATLSIKEGYNEIRRENGKRFIAVQTNIRNKDLGSFVEEAKQNIKEKVIIPPESWILWGGQFENLLSARNRLLIVVPVSFLLIFMLLHLALQSSRYALLVFSGVPLALTGGIIMLWLRRMPFSISAAIGFIALSGIAVLNSLVLITYINQLRENGMEKEESIIIGASTRLRPVLMTALVASLGFLPMALSTSTGAEVQKPLASVVIGGLISATILTLLALPSLYKLFSKNKDELENRNI